MRHCAVQNIFNGRLACCVFLQVVIFTFALWFAIHVHIRGHVNLPSRAARAVIDNPRITSYVVTLVATGISFLNTLLLGLVLQVALRARMSDTLSLQALRGSLSFVTGQILLGVRGLKISWAWIKSLVCMRGGRKHIAPSDREYWTWLAYTSLYAVLCGSLTSSWSSFLTPTPMNLQFHFTGTQADYSAAAAQLQAIWQGSLTQYPSESSPLVTNMDAARVQNWGLADVTLYLQAGNAAATTELGSPYYMPFMGALYNGSTGGIYTTASMMTQLAGPSIPSEYTGWSRTYTTVQQGLSAEVQCRQQAFINATDVNPSAGLYWSESPGSSITAPNLTVPADYNILRGLLITDCSNYSVAYTSDILAMVNTSGYPLGDGVLVGSVCQYQDFEKASNQSFLVLLQGFAPSYSFITPTICQVSPRITTVNVEFDGITVNINDTTNSEPLDPAGHQAAYIDQISNLIWYMIFDTQGLSGNSMAAGIQFIGYAYDDSLTMNSSMLNFALENYLRGAIEFLATVWQVELQPMSNTSMAEYTGVTHVGSMGYEYSGSTSLFLLVPLAVVVIITCAAALYTPVEDSKKPGDVFLQVMRTPVSTDGTLRSFGDLEDFDPTNIIHLMTLASRTGLETEAGKNEVLQIQIN
ncbi:uncharacterized protein EDB91DRAFT_1344052 [Suillus paluster]|uniref:uncharacterized protein n=1 Tax=Suillus paluster TaxID=48578 RepID=UPI001B886FCE|nr:uncharacterized protein EDB91DRAFT_1344052 [Suillus paluster]KAG1750343.1 hypothetical protein EDB91DRAFT_1344052 [Suillus paluster]